MYLRSSNSPHRILASVLWKKNEAILTQIPCFRAALCVVILIPGGMVQSIAAVVLETSQ